jgi:hypothetical protein
MGKFLRVDSAELPRSFVPDKLAGHAAARVAP